MLIFFICVVISVVVELLDDVSIESILYSSFRGILVGLFLWFLFGGFIPIVFDFPTQEKVEEVDIVSLNDTNYIDNTYYIVTYNTEDNYIFRYMVETERGKQVKELKNDDNIYLLEGNYEPKIVTHTVQFVNGFYYLFGHPLFLSDNYTEIFVPIGTITDNYSIDLN